MLREDIDEFLKTIPEDVNVVAATKYVNASDMIDLYNHNVKIFGENRVEAFLEKYEALKDYKDIEWHFIGHLQRNKANKIIDKIDCLESLDSLELASIIDKKRTKPLNCFIEVSINLEENKNGVPYMDINSFIKEVLKFKNINVCGFMMMAIKNDSDDDITNQFNKLRELRDKVESDFNIKLPYLSMGMSNDYKDAIKAGATHIRLGRILWNLMN